MHLILMSLFFVILCVAYYLHLYAYDWPFIDEENFYGIYMPCLSDLNFDDNYFPTNYNQWTLSKNYATKVIPRAYLFHVLKNELNVQKPPQQRFSIAYIVGICILGMFVVAHQSRRELILSESGIVIFYIIAAAVIIGATILALSIIKKNYRKKEIGKCPFTVEDLKEIHNRHIAIDGLEFPITEDRDFSNYVMLSYASYLESVISVVHKKRAAAEVLDIFGLAIIVVAGLFLDTLR